MPGHAHELAPRLTEVALCMLPAYATGQEFVQKLIEHFALAQLPGAAGQSVGEMQERVCQLLKQLVENGQVALYKEQIRAEKALDLVVAEAKK